MYVTYAIMILHYYVVLVCAVLLQFFAMMVEMEAMIVTDLRHLLHINVLFEYYHTSFLRVNIPSVLL